MIYFVALFIDFVEFTSVAYKRVAYKKNVYL